MSRACKNERRGDAPKRGPDGGSFDKGGSLKVSKHDGRERTGKGSYEEQTQLNRTKNPTVIKYQ